jgi:hypothetical protein
MEHLNQVLGASHPAQAPQRVRAYRLATMYNTIFGLCLTQEVWGTSTEPATALYLSSRRGSPP